MKGIMKDASILFAITLIAGVCLGAVHEVTKDPIAAAQLAAATATYKEVYPDAASFEETDDLKSAVEACDLSGQDFGNVSVDGAQEALDASGNVIGYLITSTSNDGYNGTVQISVGVTKENTLTGIGFLSISETPGLGMKAKEPEFKDQFNGKPVATFSVTKTAPASDAEIQAISGATFTSKATTGAVNAAVYFVENCITQ